MRKITLEDLEHLAIGAAILGSGGGGNPKYNHLITRHMMETYGPVHLKTSEELTEEDVVAPVAFMGAPLVGLEKIASGKEFPAIFHAMEKEIGKRPSCIMPAEIGGANAFTPLWVGAMLGIPVLDGDLIGRAFPELQMSTTSIHQISASPAFLADCLGNHVVINAKDPHSVERIARHNAMAMGSRAGVSLYLMNKSQVEKAHVKGSLSYAITLGKVIEEAKKNKKNPTEALLKQTNGTRLISGTIVDVDQKVERGFLMGCAKITSSEKEVKLLYQNEYLAAYQEGQLSGCTPDILMLMEVGTGTPVTSDALRYGIRVDLISFRAADIWYSEAGMNLVGPKYFGYGDQYVNRN